VSTKEEVHREKISIAYQVCIEKQECIPKLHKKVSEQSYKENIENW
jgi:hypothetical protein